MSSALDTIECDKKNIGKTQREENDFSFLDGISKEIGDEWKKKQDTHSGGMSARPGLVVVVLRCERLEFPPGAEGFLRDIEFVIDEIAVSRSAVEVFHAIDEQGLQDDRKDEEASDEDHRLFVSFLDEIEEESEEASHEEEGEEIGYPGIEGEGDVVVAFL